VLADSNLREELRRNGRERAGLFDWGKAAEETARVFRSQS
jgi:glycosyltransferase involved in cell wall biosynthesis